MINARVHLEPYLADDLQVQVKRVFGRSPCLERDLLERIVVRIGHLEAFLIDHLAFSSIWRISPSVNRYVFMCSSKTWEFRLSHSSVITACSTSSSRLCSRIFFSCSSEVCSAR